MSVVSGNSSSEIRFSNPFHAALREVAAAARKRKASRLPPPKKTYKRIILPSSSSDDDDVRKPSPGCIRVSVIRTVGSPPSSSVFDPDDAAAAGPSSAPIPPEQPTSPRLPELVDLSLSEESNNAYFEWEALTDDDGEPDPPDFLGQFLGMESSIYTPT